MISIGVALVLLGQVELERSALVKRTRDYRGTKVTLALSGVKQTEKTAEAFDAALSIFDKLERSMNPARPGTPLEYLEAKAGTGEAVELPPELCGVVAAALDGAKRTNGAYDPTSDCAWKNVELKACAVTVKTKDVKLELGQVAFAWGADQAASVLKKAGFKDFFVQAGPAVVLAGMNGDKPWKLGIRDPHGAAEKSFARGEPGPTALSTHGDYDEALFRCMPAAGAISATALTKSAVEAEVLARAMFVLGPAEGLKLAKAQKASAVIVDPSGAVKQTKGPKLELFPLTGFGDVTPVP